MVEKPSKDITLRRQIAGFVLNSQDSLEVWYQRPDAT